MKLKDHCHITGNVIGSTHKEHYLNLGLTKKIPVMFHNSENYDTHLIFQELGKYNFKINVIPKTIENNIRVLLMSNLLGIQALQITSILNNLLDNLTKNFGENAYDLVSQEFNSDVIGLVKKKIIFSL